MKYIVGLLFILSAFLINCNGCDRELSNIGATSFGADWVVVQYSSAKDPINCWKLKDTSIANEEHSDGIQWKADGVGMVHIAGWYTRIQVENGNFKTSLQYLGLNPDGCPGGRYIVPNEKETVEVHVGDVTVN